MNYDEAKKHLDYVMSMMKDLPDMDGLRRHVMRAMKVCEAEIPEPKKK